MASLWDRFRMVFGAKVSKALDNRRLSHDHFSNFDSQPVDRLVRGCDLIRDCRLIHYC